MITVNIKESLNENFLSIDNLKDIWLSFIKMDKKMRGFVTLRHVFDYLDETVYSVLAPFLERFFQLIDKRIADQCYFEEFFPSLCTFCMFTRNEVIAFVFSMLDKDNDRRLS